MTNSRTFCLLGIMICLAATPVRADYCSDFLYMFDVDGRTVTPILLDEETVLNEGHLPILVETGGILPPQSAFYEGPTNARKEINVTRWYFDNSQFKSHVSARISKVLVTNSPADGERHLGVWSYGLKSGDPSYFFYLKVARSNFVDFDIITKQCYTSFSEALNAHPELDDLFNSGTPYMTTEIANVNDNAFDAAVGQVLSLEEYVLTASELQQRLTTARGLSIEYRKLKRLLRRLRKLHDLTASDSSARRFRRIVRKGRRLDSSNADEADSLNQTLSGL